MVKHVFDAKGWHAVEVDGKLGAFSFYQAPAFSLCGRYMAFTDYFGEAIFRVEKLQYEGHSISKYDEAKDADVDPSILAARWQREKEEYVKAHQ